MPVIFLIISLFLIMSVAANLGAIVDRINRPAEVNPFGKYKLYRKTIESEEFYYAKVQVCRILPIYRVFRAIDERVNGLNGRRASASTLRKQFLWLDKNSLVKRLNLEYEEESKRKKVKKEIGSKGKRIHV